MIPFLRRRKKKIAGYSWSIPTPPSRGTRDEILILSAPCRHPRCRSPPPLPTAAPTGRRRLSCLPPPVSLALTSRYGTPTPPLAAAAAAGRLHRFWPHPLRSLHRPCWPPPSSAAAAAAVRRLRQPPPPLSAAAAASTAAAAGSCRCRRQPPPLPASAAAAVHRIRLLSPTPPHKLLWMGWGGGALGVSEQ